MARLRSFTRSDGSTVKVTPAEYDRRSRLQRAALERRGLVVLTDKRGRQRGYAPELVAAEVARRERLAERARVRAELRRRITVYADDVDPCDLDSVRAWIAEAIPALYDLDPGPGDRVVLSAGPDLVWASSELPAPRELGPRKLELAGWRHDLIQAVAGEAGRRCAQIRRPGQPNPGGGSGKAPQTVALGSYDPATGAIFVPELQPDAPPVVFTLTLTRPS